MITAKIRRPLQCADKRGQMPRKPGDLIPLPASILNPPVIDHDESLSSRSQRVPTVKVGVAKRRPHSHRTLRPPRRHRQFPARRQALGLRRQP